MTALIIGVAERERIAELRAFAAGQVKDAEAVMALRGAELEAYRDAMRMHAMELPRGYRVCYSHERGPRMPPPGVCAHLSVSVDRPGMLPSPEAVDAILEAFGMRPHQQADGVWVEDVAPGQRAVNVVQLLSTAPE